MSKLKCPGAGRDKDCDKALVFYFNRPVTDDEMRFLHACVQRAAECAPYSTCKPVLSVVKCPPHHTGAISHE